MRDKSFIEQERALYPHPDRGWLKPQPGGPSPKWWPEIDESAGGPAGG